MTPIHEAQVSDVLTAYRKWNEALEYLRSIGYQGKDEVVDIKDFIQEGFNTLQEKYIKSSKEVESLQHRICDLVEESESRFIRIQHQAREIEFLRSNSDSPSLHQRGQAEAWEAVWNLCTNELGASHFGKSGLQAVLDFIQGMSVELAQLKSTRKIFHIPLPLIQFCSDNGLVFDRDEEELPQVMRFLKDGAKALQEANATQEASIYALMRRISDLELAKITIALNRDAYKTLAEARGDRLEELENRKPVRISVPAGQTIRVETEEGQELECRAEGSEEEEEW